VIKPPVKTLPKQKTLLKLLRVREHSLQMHCTRVVPRLSSSYLKQLAEMARKIELNSHAYWDESKKDGGLSAYHLSLLHGQYLSMRSHKVNHDAELKRLYLQQLSQLGPADSDDV
jgi:hypothetical protein